VLTTTLVPKAGLSPRRSTPCSSPVLHVLNVRYADYLNPGFLPSPAAARVTLGHRARRGTVKQCRPDGLCHVRADDANGNVLTIALNEPNLRSGIDALRGTSKRLSWRTDQN